MSGFVTSAVSRILSRSFSFLPITTHSLQPNGPALKLQRAIRSEMPLCQFSSLSRSKFVGPCG